MKQLKGKNTVYKDNSDLSIARLLTRAIGRFIILRAIEK